MPRNRINKTLAQNERDLDLTSVRGDIFRNKFFAVFQLTIDVICDVISSFSL